MPVRLRFVPKSTNRNTQVKLTSNPHIQVEAEELPLVSSTVQPLRTEKETCTSLAWHSEKQTSPQKWKKTLLLTIPCGLLSILIYLQEAKIKHHKEVLVFFVVIKYNSK